MSNCVVAGAEWPIVRSASRLTARLGERTQLEWIDLPHRHAGSKQRAHYAALVPAARLDAASGDAQATQPRDQLDPACCVVSYRPTQLLRQHHHVQAVLGNVDAAKGTLCHLRIPFLLMRARAQATVRVWKKRLEHQAHSRSDHRGGDGLPVAAEIGS